MLHVYLWPNIDGMSLLLTVNVEYFAKLIFELFKFNSFLILRNSY